MMHRASGTSLSLWLLTAVSATLVCFHLAPASEAALGTTGYRLYGSHSSHVAPGAHHTHGKHVVSTSRVPYSSQNEASVDDDGTVTANRSDSAVFFAKRADPDAIEIAGDDGLSPDNVNRYWNDAVTAGGQLYCLMERSPNRAQRFYRDRMGKKQDLRVNPYTDLDIGQLQQQREWTRGSYSQDFLPEFASCLNGLGLPPPEAWDPSWGVNWVNTGTNNVSPSRHSGEPS